MALPDAPARGDVAATMDWLAALASGQAISDDESDFELDEGAWAADRAHDDELTAETEEFLCTRIG